MFKSKIFNSVMRCGSNACIAAKCYMGNDRGISSAYWIMEA